jgi:peptidoglycan/LPS O-acetylase OafA/YrhL
MVLVYHAVAVPRSSDTWSPVMATLWYFQVGVALFFVISGYCIAAAGDNALRHQTPWRTFAWRRARRIYPPYIIALGGTVLLAASLRRFAPAVLTAQPNGLTPLPALQTLTGGQWLGNVTLLEGVRSAFGGDQRWILPQAWSLGYEEQFYAIVGLLICILGRGWLAGVAAVTVLTAGTVVTMGAARVEGLFLDGRWLLFAMGVAVYLHVRQPPGVRRIVVPIALAATEAGIGVLAPAYGRVTPIEYLAGTLFAVSLLVLHPFDTAVATSRLLAPVRWCGTRCYSMYLIHFPVCIVIGTLAASRGLTTSPQVLGLILPAALCTTIMLTSFFFHWCERPFLNTVIAPPRSSVIQRRASATRVFRGDPAAAGRDHIHQDSLRRILLSPLSEND